MNLRQKIALSFMLYIVLCGTAFAQIVEIPDPKLRTAVRDTLNLPQGQPITPDAMLQLTGLDVIDHGIENLSGLEFARNLWWLSIVNNPITDLRPIAGLTKLETLHMWATPVSDIKPLANLTNLRFFHANYSNIADIRPIANLVELEELALAANGITDIAPLANLVKLKKLYLQYNKIVDVRPLAGLISLEELDLSENGITDVTPIVNLVKLTWLSIGDNPVSDLRPIAGLTKLDTLHMWATLVSDITVVANLTKLRFFDASYINFSNIVNYSKITDIRPVANLIELEELALAGNRITDIAPIANLVKLNKLHLQDNQIVDVRPLAGLTSLSVLNIQGNLIVDHSPLNRLALSEFKYDQTCEEPALAIQPRLENRTFPSLFTPWGILSKNQPHLTDDERLPRHDLYFSGIGMFPSLHLFEAASRWEVRGSMFDAVSKRDDYLRHNPNMVFLASFRAVHEDLGTFPEHSPYWLREDGNILTTDPGVAKVDPSHPEVQERIIQRAVAVSKCGLYDGIMLDWWKEEHQPPSVISGMAAILKGIRERVRPDFLIMGNTNRYKVPTFAPYMNGSFFESGLPHHDVKQRFRDETVGFSIMEDTISWAEQNFRAPRINSLLATGFGDEPMDSPTNRRLMRAITTLNLTFSDGYLMFHLRDLPFDGFYWYDFWDADLGRPVGGKSQLYQETEGLYIREYTNGWAVYNHSGTPQAVTLPEEVQSVSNGSVGTEHVLPDLDGEIYLRVKPKNPADVNGDGVINVFDLVFVANQF